MLSARAREKVGKGQGLPSSSTGNLSLVLQGELTAALPLVTGSGLPPGELRLSLLHGRGEVALAT